MVEIIQVCVVRIGFNIPAYTLLDMAKAWISLSLPSVVWLASAFIALASLDTGSFGVIGIIAWVVFLGGIVGFFAYIFG